MVSDPRSIVLCFFYEKQAIRRRQFAAIDCDVFMCGSYRIAGSELPRGLGAYVSPYLYSAINVQYQTLDSVGLFLPEPVFTHGQLYVALSRARSFKTITVLTNDQQINADGSVQYRTRNIVYSEVL